jgi:uncharacterized Zn-finger protein
MGIGMEKSEENVAPTRAASLNRPPPEVIEVDDTRIACDGGRGALGHPRVFLEIGKGNFIDCPYCDRRFKLRDGANHHS